MTKRRNTFLAIFMMSLGFLINVFTTPLCAAAVPSVETTTETSTWRSLFNGKNLDGWSANSSITKFRVEDGAIVSTADKVDYHAYLSHQDEFADFELTYEVKIDDRNQLAGVLVRAKNITPDELGGRVNGPRIWAFSTFSPFPNSCTGGLFLDKWYSPCPTQNDPPKTAAPPFTVDGWNRYRVLAVGPRIQTWLNGQPIADVSKEEIYRAYPAGFISLLNHGGPPSGKPWQARWRDIRIRPVAPSP